MDNSHRRFLSVRETCDELGISRPTLNRRFADGSIPSVRLGGKRLILRETIEGIVESARSAEAS